MTATGDGAGRDAGRWDKHGAEFVSWHRQASLYREIYARTVASVLAVFIVYCVAAAAGLVSRRPLAVLIVLFDFTAIGGIVWALVHGRRVSSKRCPEERAALRKQEWRSLLGFLACLGVLFVIAALGPPERVP